MNYTNETILKSIRAVYNDSKIIGLGETIHTSDGYYKCKIDIIKDLIATSGLKKVFIENPWLPTQTMMSFIKGEVTLETAMNQLLYVWRSRLIADFLLWIKKNNIELEIVGIDIQCPYEDINLLNQFGHQKLTDKLCQLYNINELDHESFKLKNIINFFKEEKNRGLESKINDIADEINSLDIPFDNTAYFSKISFSCYLKYTMTYSLGVFHNDNNQILAGSQIRDQGMAQIMKLQLKDHEKGVLWAHNLHIMKNGLKNIDRPHFGLGDHLDQMYGEDFKAIAITAYDPKINWPQIPEMTGPKLPHHKDSIENILKEGNISPRFINFSKEFNKLVGKEILMNPATKTKNLNDHFHGMIYFNNSEAMNIFKP